MTFWLCSVTSLARAVEEHAHDRADHERDEDDAARPFQLELGVQQVVLDAPLVLRAGAAGAGWADVVMVMSLCRS